MPDGRAFTAADDGHVAARIHGEVFAAHGTVGAGDAHSAVAGDVRAAGDSLCSGGTAGDGDAGAVRDGQVALHGRAGGAGQHHVHAGRGDGERPEVGAGDGEGATALFEVKVIGAESKEQAVTLSKSIVTSSLTKAAIYGHDANWGRILCAMGYSGAQFDPEKVDLYFESKAGKIQIIENGVAVNYSEEEATKILSEDAVTAIADVKMGDCTATAWGCDLTYDYIKINADYRS